MSTSGAAPQEKPDLRAFEWGSLTSGKRRTAFYVLLLPYVLANFAGWMMLPLQKDQKDPDHRVLLAPHSQGSIGAAAILGMAEDRTSRVALLTHGSLWSRCYAEFCPAVFSSDCLEALSKRLQDGDAVRWRNLYRTSDPIGGPIPVQGVDVEPLVDERKRVHESYDREDAYKQAVRELRRVLCEQQAPGQQQPEHQDEAGGAGEGGQERGALDGAGQQPTRAHRSGQGGERQERGG